jgi:chitodextrinase
MKKHQAPNSKFQINSNIQCSNFGIFGHCNLKFIWSLVLGIWNFKTRIYPSFIFIFALCSLLFTFNFSSAHAAGAQNSFTESLTTSGVVDTTPPSVPTGLAATAISQSEIDLVWNPSTDNVAVGGYVVFRDSTAIATTTSVSFADTLLTASTTYTYAIEAFDTSYNYSGLSTPVSTSTLPIPPTPTSTPTSTIPVIGQGSTNSGSSMIYNVHISADSGNAIVSFLTTLPAQSTVSYGLTPDYEIGSISSVLYDTSHQVILSGLDPETHYYVQITANAANGSQSSFITEFTTAGLPGTPLPNPSDFRAVPTTNAIDLSWTNTTDPRANEVRIVRSETFFPSDQFDGVPIYEGPGQSFRDANVTAGKTYYYAIFSEGANGLFSSGVLAKARIPLPGEVVSFATSTNPFAGITFATTNPMIAGLTLADFQFIQESKQLAIAGNNIIGVNGEENMTIRLPYNKVPQILKTIAVTLNDPTDPSKAFIFLLRANADKTFYEASIGPLGRTGIFPLTVTILDYQNQGLKQLSGSLAALAIGAYPTVKGFNQTWFWIGLIILIIILLILAVWRRKDGKKQTMPDGRQGSKDGSEKVAVPVIQTQTI